VIPRIRLDGLGRERVSAFEPGDEGRPLRIIFDRTTLSGGNVELLIELCTDNGIEAWSTSPDDPLPTLVIGGVGADDMAPVRTEDGFGGFVWPVSQIRARAQAQAVEAGADEETVYAAQMLAAASRDRNADALVTASPFLLEGTTPREGNALSLDDAFAVVGLYLRATDRFTVGKIPGERDFFGHPVVVGWWMTYLVATREHLPSMWRWFGACVAADDSLGDMVALGESVFRRVHRTLVVRDRLHVECLRVPKGRRTDEALFQLDVLLFTLSGAFDGAARVAHRAYALSGKERRASWVKDDWRNKLVTDAPDLAALFANESDEWRLVRLIGTLRNTIHGAPMSAIGTSGHERRALVGIPSEEREEVAALADALGGCEEWGLAVSSAYAYLEPDRFAERLMPPAIVLLDRILALTDVRRLPGVAGATLSEAAPEEFPFSAEIRRRLRLLTGITTI
jgi:hypothetical protein